MAVERLGNGWLGGSWGDRGVDLALSEPLLTIAQIGRKGLAISGSPTRDITKFYNEGRPFNA